MPSKPKEERGVIGLVWFLSVLDEYLVMEVIDRDGQGQLRWLVAFDAACIMYVIRFDVCKTN